MNAQPRPYRDEQDLNRMKALLIAGRAAGGPTYYVHVGDLDWWLCYLNQGDDLRQVLHLWQEERPGADPVGWSLLSPRFRAFDVFVHPQEQGTERAEQIWAWTEGRMVELVREQGGDDVLDNVNKVGLFEPLGTGPDFRRQGLGTAVLYEGLRRMKAQCMTSAMVCVDHDNPAAQRLYASVGFHALHRILTFAKKV